MLPTLPSPTTRKACQGVLVGWLVSEVKENGQTGPLISLSADCFTDSLLLALISW